MAKTDKLHNAQRERESRLDERFSSLSEHLYEQQVAMENSCFGLCNEMHNEQLKLRAELEYERKLIHEGSKLTGDSDQIVYLEQHVAYLKILLENFKKGQRKTA